MKHIKSSVFNLFATFLCIIIFIACQDKPHCVQQVEICDITDPLLVKPDAEFNISLFNLSHDRNHECRFKRVFISDKQLNPSSEVILEGNHSNLNRRPYERDLQIIQFYKEIKDIIKLDSAATLNSIRDHSECFRTIANEITLASLRPSYRTIIVVHTNLRENSDLCNTYSNDLIRIMLRNPEYLEQIFEKQDLLPKSLKSFYIVFVYETLNREDDAIFKILSHTYKSILEKRGANVNITSTNSKQLFYES